MADQNTQIEQEIRDEIRRVKRAPKREKKRGGPRLLPLLLVLAVLLGAAGFAAKHHITGAESLRRLFTYGKAAQDGDSTPAIQWLCSSVG